MGVLQSENIVMENFILSTLRLSDDSYKDKFELGSNRTMDFWVKCLYLEKSLK